MGCVRCTVVAGFGPALTTSLLKMLLALHEWLIARRILIPCLGCFIEARYGLYQKAPGSSI
jgi:hypothetical protein